jgi:plastocyanin domain-containing protein
MTPDKIFVIILGLGLIAGIAWFFWGPRKGGYRTPLTSGGYQEAMILVKGGYTPDVVVVQHGRPVRLNFRREESAACSEMVVFGDFGKSAKLPEGEIVPIELLPDKPGDYAFSCQMGMFRGRLVVE